MLLQPEVLDLLGRHLGLRCQGRLQGRRFSVVLDIPTIGCAKSLLCGSFDEPALARGSSSPILLEGETVGAALRTRAGVTPVFVSPGHRADLESSVALALQCAPRWRIPEPIRLAHALVNKARLIEGRGEGESTVMGS